MTQTEAGPQRLHSRPATGQPADHVLVLEAPYKGLSYYSERDAAYFFGRERATQIVTANLMASRLTLLYGESGVGKSSLLRAGVARHLHELALENIERRRTPNVVVAVFPIQEGVAGDVSWRDEPLDGIALAIERAVEALGLVVDAPPRDLPFGELLAAWTALLQSDLLIVLDQFEEYLLYHPGEDGDGTLASELPQVLAQPNLRASFLISIREDALAKLDRFKGRIPTLFDSYLRVRHLDREAARDAIVKPVGKYNEITKADPPITIEDKLVDALLDELEAGRVVVGLRGVGSSGTKTDDADEERRVETPYLQLVMTRLWREERQAGSTRLRWATLDRLGHSEQIVRTHLDGALADLPPGDRDVAARIFRYLVTPSGTKIAHAVSDLAAYADAREDDVARVVDRLSSGDARILRPVGDRTFEIYHDVLAAAVLDWCARYVQVVRERSRRRKRLALVSVALVLAGGALAAAVVAWQRQAAKANDATGLVAQRTEAMKLRYATQIFLGHTDAVTSAEFSRNGGRVVTASRDGTLRLWSVRTGAELQSATSGPLETASFGPGDSLVAAGGEDGAYMWSTTTNRLVPLGIKGAVVAVDFRRNGRSLLVGRASGEIDFVDWPQSRRRAHFATGGRLRAMDLDAQDTNLVTASQDGLAREFALGTPTRLLRTLRAAKDGPATDAAISAQGRVVATAAADGTARAWPPPALGSAAALQGSTPVTAVAVSPGGGLVAVGRSNGTVAIWSWRTKTIFAVLRGHTGAILSIAFNANGRALVTAGADRTARVWHVAQPNLTVQIESVSRPASNRVSATVRVANVGDASSPPTVVVLTSAGGGVARARVPRLEPSSAFRTDGLLAIPPTSGSVTVAASVNTEQRIPEQSYADDSATGSSGQLPDLSVETLGIDQFVDAVVITVGVSNRGTAASSATALKVEVPGIGSKIVAIEPLQPGSAERYEVPIRFPASAAGKRVIGYVTLDSATSDGSRANNQDQTAPLTITAPQRNPAPTVRVVDG